MRNENHDTNGRNEMDATQRSAIEATIAAIITDPIEWARADRAKFLKTLGSGGLGAREWSESELRARAAEELARVRELLAEAGEPEESEPVDVDRLMRANARARRAVENLES
jgi:hypothetical protein